MSMHFRALAEQAMTDGAIAADEILALRGEGWSNGAIDADEAEAIFVLNDHLAEPSAQWSEFFVEALSEYVVNGLMPRGYVDDGQADWLIERIDQDGRIETMTELELLVRVLEKALGAPERLKAYARDQIEQAVLSGEGPTRDGGRLEKGNVNATEARLLRRMIFAPGSERPAAVGRGEAEMLFRLKDACLGADNAPEWKQLFVQGVGNYLQGFGGSDPLTRERAAELESFMNNAASSIGGFFARMARSNVKQGFGDVFGKRDKDPEVFELADAARDVTDQEHDWLQTLIDANGQVDEYDQALLDFLAEE